MRRKGFLIGGIIVVLAMAYLAYMGFASSATYYYTVGELLDRGSPVSGQDVRVAGKVDHNPIRQEPGSSVLRFSLMEGERVLPVAYQGVVPDALTAGGDVVIEGYLDGEGVFQAHSILTKCPSRYVPGE